MKWGGASLLSESAEDAFTRGTITPSGLSGNATDGYTCALNSSVSTISVSKFATSDQVEVDSSKYTVSIHKGSADGEELASDATLDEVGSYYIVVTANESTEFAGSSCSLKFTVGAVDVADATVTYKNADGDTITELCYTGYDLSASVVVSLNGQELTQGTDYDVKFLLKATDNVDSAEGVTLKDAQYYYAYITGKGNYTGKLVTTIQVKQFDLSSAKITVDDVYTNTKPSNPTKVVDGHGCELNPSLVTLTMIVGDTPSLDPDDDLFDEAGEYGFKATSSDKNVTGEQARVAVNKVDSEVSFLYNGSAITESYSLKNGESFDTSLLKAKGYESTDLETVSVECTTDTTDASITVSDGNKITEPGTYEVTVELKAADTSYKASGKATITVTIAGKPIDADLDAYFYNKDDVIITEDSFEYDPTRKLSDYSFKVLCEKQDVTSDVTGTWTDAEGNELEPDTVMDAGTYTYTLSSVKYDLSGVKTLTVTVSAKDLSQLTYDSVTYLGDTFAPEGYTAQAVTPDTAEDEDDYWQVFTNTSEVSVSFKKLNETTGEYEAVSGTYVAGSYQMVIELAEDAKAENYTLPSETTIEFVCRNAQDYNFRDVTADMWQYDAVNAVAAKGIMNGYDHTSQTTTVKTLSGVDVVFDNDSVFGVENHLTRAEACQVLYNMAAQDSGYKMDETDIPQYNEEYGYVTGFEDVDGSKAWYSEKSYAIAWCRNVGIVNGYNSTTFKPEQDVTAEELAIMLQNYASVIDLKDTTTDGSSLATMSDASDVSDWAEDAVDWAVKNEVLGANGWVHPSEAIARGRVAKMVANYLGL